MGEFGLTGRVAVVTGGGRGIGEGIARAFADAGACVVLAARTSSEIECVATSIRDQGGRAIAVRADVTDTFALGSLATRAVDEFGHLDIWVNNAGGTEAGRPLAELKRSEWDEVVDLNFTAVWNGSMAAVEQMRWGSIINVSSMAAFGAMPGKGHYAACKAAVISLTRTMAVELAPDIRVNAIAPGIIPTKLLFEAAEVEGIDMDELASRVPLGLGTAADVGAAAVYLASPAARWVTGQTIQVAGGSQYV
ncbi:MAG TPA: glucose 1-dehydrogenase [Ilumatobacteraceae bacterium]|nr:glucose 1-dehydrogenase [Ilumatobacteraceae bacterium]